MKKGLQLAKAITFLGALAMAGIITYAFIYGNFAQEGAVLTSLAWGIVSLVDLYVGFTIFSLWVVFREKSLIRSIIWVFLVMVLGSFRIALYTFLALLKSKGDLDKFFYGRRKS
jgi:hypothetical protein